jgi:hypothetical protein
VRLTLEEPEMNVLWKVYRYTLTAMYIRLDEQLVMHNIEPGTHFDILCVTSQASMNMDVGLLYRILFEVIENERKSTNLYGLQGSGSTP